LAALVFGLLACQDKGPQNIVLEDQKARVSYSIGLNFGNNLKQQSIEVDPPSWRAASKMRCSALKRS